LAGDKADNWWMRFHERALNLRWKKGTKRSEKSNAIDMLCSGQVPPKNEVEKEEYERVFEEVPKPFTEEEREAWLSKLGEVAVSSDAFVSLFINCFFLENQFIYLLHSSHSSTTSSGLPDQELNTLRLRVVARTIMLCLTRLRNSGLRLSSRALDCSTTDSITLSTVSPGRENVNN
jgi:hypothetical protein